jgi:Family of unknown function (DUF6460)
MGTVLNFFLYDLTVRISAGLWPLRDARSMLGRLTRRLLKVLIASLIVGTVLAHFGISTSDLIRTAGLSPDRIEDRITDLARDGLAWALPNLLLGSLVIIPIWFVVFLFRPPGESPD